MKKIAIGSSLLFAVFAAMTLMASAATPLSVSCTGTPGATSITWGASVSGGNPPVSVLWSNGSTSTSQTVAVAPGTYTLSVTATDASSTVATSSCSATVVPPAPTIVSFAANPGTIQTGQSSMLWWNVTGANTLSINNGVGTVTGTSTTVSPTMTTTYTLTAANANGTTTASATVMVTASTTATTTTTIIPLKRHQSLTINENGNFVARGMLIQSIASGSFTATVWGITYTVLSSTPVTVGDYADVQGKISTSSPMTVMAHVVRDRPSQKVITMTSGTSGSDEQGNQGDNGNGNGHAKVKVHKNQKHGKGGNAGNGDNGNGQGNQNGNGHGD